MAPLYIAGMLAMSVLLASGQVLPKKKVVEHVLVYLYGSSYPPVLHS